MRGCQEVSAVKLLSERPCIIIACRLVHNELGLNFSMVNIANLLYYTVYNTCTKNIYEKVVSSKGHRVRVPQRVRPGTVRFSWWCSVHNTCLSNKLCISCLFC